MKKTLLSLVLCVAMLLTAVGSMTAMTAFAADPIELKNIDYVVEGKENVTVNEDGSWTITGKVGMSVNLEYDYTAMSYIYQSLTTDTPVKITLYDADGEKWINLYGNWSGPDFYPAGDYANNDSIKGVYDWNSLNNGWTTAKANTANVSAIYIEFEGADAETATGNLTLKELYLNDGNTKPAEVDLTSANYADPENGWKESVELVSTTASDWVGAAAGDSEIVIGTNENGNVTFGNTAGSYPSASITLDQTVPYEEAAVYFDFSVLAGGQTTVYLFFGEATATDFEGAGKGYYAVVSDVGVGNYTGYVALKDMIASDSDLIVDGNVKISALKVYGSTANVAADVVNPAVVMNSAMLYSGFAAEGDVTAAAPTTTKPTEAAPTNAGTTTTANKGGAATTTPKTADTTESVLFVVVAAAAVAVVTLSAVASKKAQSR